MVMLDGVDAFPTVPKQYLDFNAKTLTSTASSHAHTATSTATGTSTPNSATPASASATASGAAIVNKPIAVILGGALAMAVMI